MVPVRMNSESEDVVAFGSPPSLRRLRLAIKDNIATERKTKTTCGSGILNSHYSPFEASVVRQLRDNGYFVVGKTNLDEFGMGSHSRNSFFGPVKNPVEQYSAGGSSGGSAVAVATYQSDVALGTDTGGSVRLPAAYNGIVGFKPSYGLISRFGVIPYANSLDTVGFLTQSVKDAMHMLGLTRSHDHRDPTSLSSETWGRLKEGFLAMSKSDNYEKYMTTLKIGVPVDYNIAELDPGVRAAWESTLELFQENGCTIVPVSLPNTKHALSAYYVLAAAEAASNLSKYDGVRYGTRGDSSDGIGDVLYSGTRGEGFGDEVKRRILLGSYTLSSEAMDNYFIKAQKVRRLVQRDFDRVFSTSNPLRPAEQFDLGDMEDSIELNNKLGPAQVDVIICPTAPTPPPLLDDVSKQSPVESYMNDVFTVPASLAGLPAISVPFELPAAFRKPGTLNEAGIQIIGQYLDDFRVLSTANILHWLQAAKNTRRKLKPIQQFQDFQLALMKLSEADIGPDVDNAMDYKDLEAQVRELLRQGIPRRNESENPRLLEPVSDHAVNDAAVGKLFEDTIENWVDTWGRTGRRKNTGADKD
ncbi:hypothetical protein B7494_g7156 [Chlorociboria aeruginascens]|nr:hypothetical protein B7494_g7156 [Chlorociboria aeruginascens]